MTKTSSNPIIVTFCLVFAFFVLGVSIMSASIASSSLDDTPFSSRKLRFSAQIMPGNVLFPFVVIKDKASLLLMDTSQQCLQRLNLALERLDQAKRISELGDQRLALQTMIKGQRYLSEATTQCQQSNLDQKYKDGIIKVVEQYQQQLTEIKPRYADTDRAILDQLMSENEALQTHLGKNGE